MGERVMLLLDCRDAGAYGLRRELASLYAGRFDETWFLVGPGVEADPAFDTLVSTWEPPPVEACGCGRGGPHPTSAHHVHVRLAGAAESVMRRSDYVAVVDAAALLPGKKVSREGVLATLVPRNLDAATGRIYLAPRDQEGYDWPRRPSGYPAFEASGVDFGTALIYDHFSAATGGPPVPLGYPPLFSCCLGCFYLKSTFLGVLAGDLEAMAGVWSELAVPTAILGHTARVAWLKFAPLWGDDQLSTGKALGLLKSHDWAYPFELEGKVDDDFLAAYRHLA
jgi:hypothetical protein